MYFSIRRLWYTTHLTYNTINDKFDAENKCLQKTNILHIVYYECMIK